MKPVHGRILIADDDSSMARLLGNMVSREGLTPLLAKDGTEALQLVRAGDPDVLLADIRMPGMNSMELMRKAKEIDPELPVILITAFAQVQGAVEALRAGAHDYLAKPFEHQQVIRVVLRALNERRLAPLCVEFKVNQCRNENEVINLACLVKRDAQEMFSAGVFAAANFFDNNFSFDYSGPWAPHNFVQLELEQ